MSSGTRCTCGAGHQTYGACIRAKGLHIGQVDRSEQKKWDSDIAAYRAARRQGIQPPTTQRKDVEAAVAVSDHLGRAYSASDGGFGV